MDANLISGYQAHVDAGYFADLDELEETLAHFGLEMVWIAVKGGPGLVNVIRSVDYPEFIYSSEGLIENEYPNAFAKTPGYHDQLSLVVMTYYYFLKSKVDPEAAPYTVSSTDPDAPRVVENLEKAFQQSSTEHGGSKNGF